MPSEPTSWPSRVIGLVIGLAILSHLPAAWPRLA
jgi:hypothetical protein